MWGIEEGPLITLLLLAACTRSCAPDAPIGVIVPPSSTAPPPAPTEDVGGGAPTSGDLHVSCEASALVPWDGGWLVGDNEDVARLYAYDADFAARPALPLAAEVGDIEALALDADGVWVVGSHSTAKDGQSKPKRERILRPDGTVVTLDLAACPACDRMRGVSSALGGLNVEGAAWAGDRLWVGLRSPLAADGSALLLVADRDGHVERVIEQDLGGHGVRDLLVDGDALLIVAGPTLDADEPHALWRLAGPDAAATRLDVALPASTEGAAIDPADPSTLVYVTDGAGKPGACETPARWGRIPLPR